MKDKVDVLIRPKYIPGCKYLYLMWTNWIEIISRNHFGSKQSPLTLVAARGTATCGSEVTPVHREQHRPSDKVTAALINLFHILGKKKKLGQKYVLKYTFSYGLNIDLTLNIGFWPNMQCLCSLETGTCGTESKEILSGLALDLYFT